MAVIAQFNGDTTTNDNQIGVYVDIKSGFKSHQNETALQL